MPSTIMRNRKDPLLPAYYMPDWSLNHLAFPQHPVINRAIGGNKATMRFNDTVGSGIFTFEITSVQGGKTYKSAVKARHMVTDSRIMIIQSVMLDNNVYKTDNASELRPVLNKIKEQGIQVFRGHMPHIYGQAGDMSPFNRFVIRHNPWSYWAYNGLRRSNLPKVS